MLPLFSEHNEVVEVIVVADEVQVTALEPFSPEQSASDWGSVLMCSPKALRASWPVVTAPITGRGLLSRLPIWRLKKTTQNKKR